MNPEHNELQIELLPELAEGTYANLSIVAHSPSEFVIDFVRVMPNLPKAPVKSRVILSPLQARQLLAALQENIAKYEQTFGAIQRNATAKPFSKPEGMA